MARALLVVALIGCAPLAGCAPDADSLTAAPTVASALDGGALEAGRLAARDGPGLSFSVRSDAAAEVIASRLLAIAERCWVAGDGAYRAETAGPRAIALRLTEVDRRTRETLRLTVAPAEAGRLVVRAEGALAREDYRAVIERGVMQAATDVAACL